MIERYGIKNIRASFLEVLPIQILSLITSSLSSIVNGLVIGNYLSDLDMIALGYVSPITKIITVFSVIVSTGSRIISGMYIGRGDKKKQTETFTCAINLLLQFGALLTVVFYVFSDQIASILANEEAIIKTSEYIKGLSLGIIPTLMVPCLMSFLQQQNHGTYALISTLFLAISNYVIAIFSMNYLHISIFGVGVCTSIAQALTLIFIIIKFIIEKNRDYIFKVDSKNIYKDIVLVGLPSALSQLLYAVRNSLLNTIAYNAGGNTAVNALSIMYASTGPLDALNTGVSHSYLMLSSVYVGEKDKKALKTLFQISSFYGLAIAFAKIIGIRLFAGNIADIYGASEEVRQLTITLYNLFILSCTTNIIRNNILNSRQSFGKINYCNIMIIITALIAPVGYSYFASKIWGLNSIWWSHTVADVTCMISMYIYSSIEYKHPVKSISELLIPKGELEIKDPLTHSIKTIDEAINISQTVEQYCVTRGIDKTRSMYAGLCTEEATINIIEHGFPKTKKKNKVIDVFVYIENNDVNIRIKDNAIAFDPHIKIDNSNDPASNIGIRIVSKIAKRMDYQNNFNLNQLIIKL